MDTGVLKGLLTWTFINYSETGEKSHFIHEQAWSLTRQASNWLKKLESNLGINLFSKVYLTQS